MNDYFIDDIYCELLKNSIASDKTLWHIAMALSALPKEILKFATTNCAFVALDKERKGLYVDIQDVRLKGKEHIIFLPDWLCSEEGRVSTFIIARQLAYAYKKPKQLEEREADHQAIEWVKYSFPLNQ